ncbi:MAG: methyltransferase domain-containing protein [Elusimicrobia bacterium]|nr:methyltransferase domain-containing protein [Elusimicrobiota bacterium]
MLKRLIEARWVQSLVARYDLSILERLMLARHDFTARHKLRRVFGRGADPYQYASSCYELTRFSRMAALLGGRRFRSALEVGCAEGHFTKTLAALCGRVTALDLSEAALGRARRLVRQPHVTWVQANVRTWQPEESYDLMVMAEVLYYLPPPSKGPAYEKAFMLFLERLLARLAPGGLLLLAHGYGTAADLAVREDYGQRAAGLGLRRLASERIGEQPHDKGMLYCLLELFEKPGA